MSKVNEVKDDFFFDVYPNPISEYLNVLVNDDVLSSGATLKVVDAKGVEIYEAKITEKNSSIKTNSWLPGVYFMHVIQDNGSTNVKKIVVGQ